MRFSLNVNLGRIEDMEKVATQLAARLNSHEQMTAEHVLMAAEHVLMTAEHEQMTVARLEQLESMRGRVAAPGKSQPPHLY